MEDERTLYGGEVYVGVSVEGPWPRLQGLIWMGLMGRASVGLRAVFDEDRAELGVVLGLHLTCLNAMGFGSSEDDGGDNY